MTCNLIKIVRVICDLRNILVERNIKINKEHEKYYYNLVNIKNVKIREDLL